MQNRPAAPAPERLHRAALGLLALILTAVPLFFFTETRDQFELPKQLLLRALSSLLMGLLLALRLRDPALGWKRGPLDWPVLAWAVWLVVTTVHSTAPWVSWRGEYENFAGSLTQLNYVLLYFAAVQLLRDEEDLRRLLRAIGLAALAAALYAILQALQRDLIGWAATSVIADRFFGPLGNPNFLGGLMAMAIPLKLALGFDAQRRGALDPERWSRPLLVLALVLAYAAMGKGGLLLLWQPRPGSDPSSLVILLLWLLALPATLLLRRTERLREALWIGTGADLLVFFQALANTGTRGAFLGLMVGLAVLALGWARSASAGSMGGRAKRLVPALGLLLLLIGGAFFGLGASFRTRMAATLKDPLHAFETSRLQIWGPALDIWRAHPVAGTGVDSFKTVFPSYSRSRFNKYDGENVSSRMAHCEPLHVAATQGGVGLALWLWLCGAFFYFWWRGLRDDEALPYARLGLGALVAAYLGQNLVSFGVAGISAPFWVALAWPWARPRGGLRLPWPPLNAWLAAALGGLLALGGLRAVQGTLTADLGYAYASRAQEQLTALDRAGMDELRGVAGYAYQRLSRPGLQLDAEARQEFEALQPLLMQAEQRLAAEPSAAAELAGLYRRADGQLLMLLAAESLQRSVRLCPHEVKYHVYLGLAYEELFRRALPARRELWFKRAVAAYERSVDLNPGNAYYRGNLGRLFGMAAEAGAETFLPEAERRYLEALKLGPVTRLFYENLLLLYARFALIQPASALLDSLEARDKELAPRILITAASTFFQWSRSGLPAWTPALQKTVPGLAAGWAERALALEAGNGDYALALAVFREAQGRRAESKRWAQEALRLKPGDPSVLQYIQEKGLDR